jgi:polysaccharide pyruvyl transferase WcaK-like protein
MTATRVLMKGFYGYANFGDDVLMVITHGIIRRALPDANIVLMSEAKNAAYIARMLPQVNVLPEAPRAHFDLIVHGGGGVFFDFARYGWGQQVLEKMLMLCGFRALLRVEEWARRVLNRPRITTRRRVGLGIGVGGFSAGSPYLRNRLHMLAQFDALWLRDGQSSRELERFAHIMHDERIAGSDLAFLTEYWMPTPPAPRTPAARKRLGIALRDWPGLSEDALGQIIAHFARDYDICGFILDVTHDRTMQRVLAAYPTHLWQPAQMEITDFTHALGQMDVLLTSRAHAAICGACAGVPSVIVNIEPKMEQVHAMLPAASRLVAAGDTRAWAQAIADCAKVQPATIAADVGRNRSASTAALAAIERWFA